MGAVVSWPWSQSLAVAREGDFLRVKEILFGTLRDHLWETGVREGAKLEYLGRDEAGVNVRLPNGKGVRVARDHMCFVVVEFEGPRDKQGSSKPTLRLRPIDRA